MPSSALPAASADAPGTTPDATSQALAAQVEEAGVYQIVAANGSVVGLKSQGSPAAPTLESSNHAADQRWNLSQVATSREGDALYALVNVQAGTALAAGASAPCQQAFSASTAQQWRIVSASDGRSYLINASTGGYLSLDNGNNLIMTGAQARTWLLARMQATVQEGLFEVRIAGDEGKVLDIRSGSHDDGAIAQVYQANGTVAQQFVFDYDDATGYYTIVNRGSGKVLDVCGGSTEAGADVQQYVSNDTFAQLWDVVRNADGTWTLYSAKSGLALDVRNGDYSNYNPLQIYIPNGTIAQRFALKMIGSADRVSDMLKSAGTLPALASDEALSTVALDGGLYLLTASEGPGTVAAGNVAALGAAEGMSLSGRELKAFGSTQQYTQRWKLVRAGVAQTGEWEYTLVNAASGMALTANGDGLRQLDVRGSANQRWIFRALTGKDGVYRLINAYTGAYLNVAQRSDMLQQSRSLSVAIRPVAVKPSIADGSYTINIGATGDVLNVAGASSEDGAAVQAYEANGTIAQMFGVTYDWTTGYYTITSYASGKAVDVTSGSVDPGAPIQQYTPNGTLAQQWAIVAAGDGTYRLYSAKSGLALAVTAEDEHQAKLERNASSRVRTFSFSAVNPSIVAGTYVLRAGSDASLAMDVRSASTEAGAVVQAYTPNGTLAQTFGLIQLDSGEYVLVNAHSGMRLAASGSDVVQQAKSESANQRWTVAADGAGHFLIKNVKNGLYIARASGASGTALVMTAAGTNAGWTFLAARLHLGGVYVITTADDQSRALDVYYGSADSGAKIDVWNADAGNQVAFWFEEQDDGSYEIYNVWSLKNLDVPNANARVGQGIQQYVDNSTEAQRWHVEVADGGMVLASALGNYVIGHDGTTVQLQNRAAYDLNQRFVLKETEAAALGLADLMQVLDQAAGDGITVGHTRHGGLTAGTYYQLADAINAYYDVDTSVGFAMVDLTTGATVAYNADSWYFSASSVKGPYVIALNKWDPWDASDWSNTIYNIVTYSNNEAYRSLTDNFGSWPLDSLLSETGADQFSWNYPYAYYTPRTLAKLWVDMAQYLMSDDENADWCRYLFSNNSWITSRGVLGGRTVYAKSGWMVADEGDWCTVHNEGYCVMDGDHPYVVAIMSTQNHYNTWYMENLVEAIDAAHAELVS